VALVLEAITLRIYFGLAMASKMFMNSAAILT
jgi:hypothetical protein